MSIYFQYGSFGGYVNGHCLDEEGKKRRWDIVFDDRKSLDTILKLPDEESIFMEDKGSDDRISIKSFRTDFLKNLQSIFTSHEEYCKSQH